MLEIIAGKLGVDKFAHTHTHTHTREQTSKSLFTALHNVQRGGNCYLKHQIDASISTLFLNQIKEVEGISHL